MAIRGRGREHEGHSQAMEELGREFSSFDGFGEMRSSLKQRSHGSEDSFYECGERRGPSAHTMASHRFPLDHIPHSNC